MNNAKIKVIGIGTTGNDILSKIMQKGISEVELVGIDANQGNLDNLNVKSKILISENLNVEVKDTLKNTDLVFILTEMSEKNNSKIACIVSEIAKKMGILTIVAVATSIDSDREIEEIEKIKKVADTVIVLSLQKLVEKGLNEFFPELFVKRDRLFIKNLEFILNMINKQGVINLELNDIKSILKNSGEAVTAFGKSKGLDKVKLVVKQIVNNLFVKNIPKAGKILLNITAGPDIGLMDLQQITMALNEKFGDGKASILWGYTLNPEALDEIEVGMLITEIAV